MGILAQRTAFYVSLFCVDEAERGQELSLPLTGFQLCSQLDNVSVQTEQDTAVPYLARRMIMSLQRAAILSSPQLHAGLLVSVLAASRDPGYVVRPPPQEKAILPIGADPCLPALFPPLLPLFRFAAVDTLLRQWEGCSIWPWPRPAPI